MITSLFKFIGASNSIRIVEQLSFTLLGEYATMIALELNGRNEKKSNNNNSIALKAYMLNVARNE